jgi:hypothetical protein
MEAILAKGSANDLIDNLSDYPPALLPIVQSILSEARKLHVPLDIISSLDLVPLLLGQSASIATPLCPLVPVLRELVLRNPRLIQQVLQTPRPREILNNLSIFEIFPISPSFAGAREISSTRAAAAFARAAAVTRGESPMKSQHRVKAPAAAAVVEGEVADVPGLIALEEPELPTVDMLMQEHGLSRNGAETVVRRLEEKFRIM